VDEPQGIYRGEVLTSYLEENGDEEEEADPPPDA